jgi:autotransporter family porin
MTTAIRRRSTRLVLTAALVVLAAGPVRELAAAGVVGTIGGPAVAGAVAKRTTPPTTTPSVAHFTTLPPGSVLPSDAQCAAQVRPAAEVRAGNQTPNHHPGTAPNTALPRVTGSFTGSTDEILQWAACKWGIDEDIVRAQIAKESWWHQEARGDFTTDQTICDPAVRTGPGQQCPESVGLGQVRFQYHKDAFAFDDALLSSSYNVDYTYARWRECFEGGLGWLNTVERGATYAAGDAWGCVGVWFSGRWHTPAAEGYINAVQAYLNQRVWTTPDFLAG